MNTHLLNNSIQHTDRAQLGQENIFPSLHLDSHKRDLQLYQVDSINAVRIDTVKALPKMHYEHFNEYNSTMCLLVVLHTLFPILHHIVCGVHL